MTPEQIDRVFGCGRLQMVTGKHVEVFREAAVPGSRRRYTKRFLHTLEADFGQWTEREWRILARLIGHGIACVPDVVQYDRGSPGGTQLVQTYDAGVTVDQWATMLPVLRDGRLLRHVFEDCAHWWALAHHCLRALQAIHELSVVHLDIKGDNVCIPFGPPGFDPHGTDLHLFPRFSDLALIDFAFALVSRESLTTALPIGWQTDYDYQSPRLLHALEAGRRGDLQPTRQLDWRCDMYSLGAMLKRYLPDDEVANGPAQAGGWSAAHVQAAKELILALREAHDGEATLRDPHARLLEITAARLAHAGMDASLAAGWTLARDENVTPVAVSPATPVTRLAPPLRVLVTPRVTIEPADPPVVVRRRPAPPRPPSPRVARGRSRVLTAVTAFALATLGLVAVAAPDFQRWAALEEFGRRVSTFARSALERPEPAVATPGTTAASDQPAQAPDPQHDQVARADGPPTSTESGNATSAAAPPAAPEVDPAAATQSPATKGETQQAAGNAASPSVAPGPGTERSTAPAPVSRSARTRSAKAAASTPIASAPVAPSQAPVAVAKPRSTPGASVATAPPPAKLAGARLRADATASKVATPVAAATSPKRIRFFDDDPARVAGSAAAAKPVATSMAAAGESRVSALGPPTARESVAPASAEGAVIAHAAPAGATGATASADVSPPSSAVAAAVKVVPVPPPRPKATAPAANEPRSLLAFLTDLASRRDRGSAPIEDRAAAAPHPLPGSRPAVVASVPPPAADSTGNANLRPATPPAADVASPLPAPALAPVPGDDARPLGVPPAVREPRPAPRELAPRATPPGAYAMRDPYRGNDADLPDLATQARRALADSVPFAAARAQSDVARVLRVAAYAGHPAQESSIVDAARHGWSTDQVATGVPKIWPASALQLNEEARRAYVVQRNVGQAFDLQLRAFGANPRDPDVAGNLAFLFLRVNPTQPETARQLALHAIALRPAQMRTPLADDWNTLAIASALIGREADATHAFYVAVALSRDLDRNCRAALGAVERHGDVMVGPVQAMMLRIRQYGRDGESSHCAWPLPGRMARSF